MTTQNNSERETLYQSLIANYRPPVTLRTSHKKQLKTAWSIRQGHDGSKCECFFCKNLKIFSDLTIHHRDGNEDHNDAENLTPACYECNRKEGWVVRLRKKAEVVERERELTAPTESQPLEWSSEEGRRHDKMRYRWNNWIYHTNKGLGRNMGQRFNKESLPLLAVDILALGSSKTYAHYLKEDIAAGYWMEFEEDGVTKIERSGKTFPPERMGIVKK